MSSSYREILRSSTLIGGSSAANILLGLARMKVAAILLGPAGVGLIGIYQNLIATASTAASLGFGNVGTRQIAEANGQDDVQKIASARRALDWGTLALATVGSLVFWMLRRPLAVHVLDDASLATEVGWMAPGVAVTIIAGSQSALLTGLRRITEIALIRIWSGVLSTVIGVAALWAWGLEGIVVFLLAAPVANYAVAQVYVSRLPAAPLAPIRVPELVDQWKTLVRLGTAFMVAGILSTLGQLAVRSVVQRELGEDALGQFQAAWAISMTYVGFVLGAMGTDYYPRLTASIQDVVATNRLVNEQTEVALLLAGPVLIAMLAWSPWVIRLLYSDQFSVAASILRWQVLGDILKLASWPLGFILMASSRGGAFMATEGLATVAFVILVWLGIPLLGVESTGVAFIGMYLACLPLVYWQARLTSGFRWSNAARSQLIALVACGCALCFLGYWSEIATLAVGTLACLGFGVVAILRLSQMANLGGRVGQLSSKLRVLLSRIGIRNE